MFQARALLLAALPLAAAASPCTLDKATGTTIDAKPFVRNGYGARWCHANNRVLYMTPGKSGFYGLRTARPDGSDDRVLTAPGMPTRHVGAGYWHPSGRYALCIAEKQDWHSRKMFGNPDFDAMPGFGLHDDIWLIAADGKRCWKLTDEPGGKHQGALMPVFSPDGKKVAWASSQGKLRYALKVADFVETPTPHLANIRSYQPGGPTYYETGSFTSDSNHLAYTSDQDTHSFWLSQIYLLNLSTGRSTRLTRGVTYNEHPTVVKTPTGDWIVYMSSEGNRRFPGHLTLGTDWWAVRPDGTGKKRLTSMNLRGNPESNGQPQVACTVAVSPKGDFMLGDVQDSLTRQTGLVRVIHFTASP